MRTSDYGFAITDDLTKQFTENLITQIQLVWKMMWQKNEIRGRHSFTITYHGQSMIYGYVSFDLPNKTVDVQVSYLRSDYSEPERVFNYADRLVNLHGLVDEFKISLCQQSSHLNEK